jgi:hypothetical protein
MKILLIILAVLVMDVPGRGSFTRNKAMWFCVQNKEAGEDRRSTGENIILIKLQG